MSRIDHIAGRTYHGRKGGTRNAFSYGVDYLLLDAEAEVSGPLGFGRNRRRPVSLCDSDHGGAPGQGAGAAWVRQVLADHDCAAPARVELLAQPRVFGHVFNPVSFWLCRDEADRLVAVIAEVTNTYGDRHSYLCRRDDGGEIAPSDTLTAEKIFYVSPFQPVEGRYAFNFDISGDHIDIRIDYQTERGGLGAPLGGARHDFTFSRMIGALLRRPFGSRRGLALIHWQALKLWLKKVPFLARPEPPKSEISQ